MDHFQVRADLTSESSIPGKDIEVETDTGVVSLSTRYTLLTDTQKDRAIAITKMVEGVRDVITDGL